ncbi:MAG TPA: winged helix DNA-binding protein [Atribacterota bacterium]|nr:winged helix DNA-binding protein [Atribacterota bacterium]
MKAIIVIMKDIYDKIIKLKHFCLCHEYRLSSTCRISIAELKGVNVMEEGQLISCSDFSRRINISPSRGSRIIDNLVRKGLLSRSEKENDRRAIFLSLTEKGREIKKNIDREQQKFELLLASQLADEDMELIKKGLQLLEKIMKSNEKGDNNVRNNLD